MSPNRERMTLTDYVVIALNPALIMAMVGALVFFLVEVLYVGEYQSTLLYILFFFVFGGVLVSRIAIEYGDSRATLYGAFLGGAAWLATMRYLESSQGAGIINFFLLALIWWCSHRLTRDCTVIDDAQDASGVGLLQQAGVEGTKDIAAGPDESDANVDDPPPLEEKNRKKRKEVNVSAINAWRLRYHAYREKRDRQPHAPGVWVVYFSLAALPLYGVGQSLIPSSDLARRQYVFWLMSIYVAAGLGLLLTTSFLGLRRYLRQKKLQMPWPITVAWMSIGFVLIVLFLVFGALLPRPSAEFALIDLPARGKSTKLDADKNAFRQGEGGKGDSRRVVKDKDAGKDAAKGNKDEAGKKIEGKSKGKDAAAKKGDGKDKGAADKKNGDVANPKDKGRNEPAKADDLADQPPTPILESASELLAKLAEFLRPILIAIIVLVVLFVVGRALLVFLANFTGWAAGLLNFFRSFGALFRSEKGEPDEVLESVSAPPPFTDFTDPFATGTASSMSPAELVRYTFEALEAWSWARDLARKPGETPFELAARIGEERPGMEDCVQQLANYYASLAYANATLSNNCRDSIRECWRQMSGAAASKEKPIGAPM